MDIIERICKDATKRDYGYIYSIRLHENGYVISPCEEDGTSYEDDVLYLYDFKGSLIASSWRTVREKSGRFKKMVEVPEKYRYKTTETTIV